MSCFTVAWRSKPLALTVPQAAAELGIGVWTAYEAVKRGRLPAVRFGRRIVVPRSALERLLDGQAAAPTAGEAAPHVTVE